MYMGRYSLWDIVAGALGSIENHHSIRYQVPLTAEGEAPSIYVIDAGHHGHIGLPGDGNPAMVGARIDDSVAVAVVLRTAALVNVIAHLGFREIPQGIGLRLHAGLHDADKTSAAGPADDRKRVCSERAAARGHGGTRGVGIDDDGSIARDGSSSPPRRPQRGWRMQVQNVNADQRRCPWAASHRPG